MVFVVILVLGAILCGIKAILSSTFNTTLIPGMKSPLLTVRCADMRFTPEPSGPSLPLKRVTVSGTLAFPKPGQSVTVMMDLTDITTSTDGSKPVLCAIPGLCGEGGRFHVEQQITIADRLLEVSDLELTPIPLFALVCPVEGTRELRLSVAIVDAEDASSVFHSGSATFPFVQEFVGYEAVHERIRTRECHIASLALAVAASDFNVDSEESTVIRRFFSERFGGLHDEGRRRAKVAEALQDLRARLKARRETPEEAISRLCAEVTQDDEASKLTAYELCVQVVAADKSVDPREQRALVLVAERLNLPGRYVQEIRDRHLRIAMYADAADDHLIGMPAGLSHDAKLEFLSSEYRRWRARVTHKDPGVAAEATLRLERIAKLRRRLTDAAA